MTRDEARDLVEDLVRKYEGHFDPSVERLDEPYDAPTDADWALPQEELGCSFSPALVGFMEPMTAYHCPGVGDVTREGRTNGDSTIDWTYDHELSFGRCDADLVPFLDIGDGTYYCLRIGAGETPGLLRLPRRRSGGGRSLVAGRAQTAGGVLDG